MTDTRRGKNIHIEIFFAVRIDLYLWKITILLVIAQYAVVEVFNLLKTPPVQLKQLWFVSFRISRKSWRNVSTLLVEVGGFQNKLLYGIYHTPVSKSWHNVSKSWHTLLNKLFLLHYIIHLQGIVPVA